MALKKVVDAVAARLSAQWDRCPVYGINDKGETPGDGSPFVQISFPVANGEQLTVGDPGNNVYRETGAFHLAVHAQRGAGVTAGLTMADELATLFRGKNFDGVQTFAPSSPAIDDRNEEGMYFTLSVAVPYQADLLG